MIESIRNFFAGLFTGKSKGKAPNTVNITKTEKQDTLIIKNPNTVLATNERGVPSNYAVHKPATPMSPATYRDRNGIGGGRSMTADEIRRQEAERAARRERERRETAEREARRQREENDRLRREREDADRRRRLAEEEAERERTARYNYSNNTGLDVGDFIVGVAVGNMLSHSDNDRSSRGSSRREEPRVETPVYDPVIREDISFDRSWERNAGGSYSEPATTTSTTSFDNDWERNASGGGSTTSFSGNDSNDSGGGWGSDSGSGGSDD